MNNEINKIALGTVQFGLKYGIKNQTGIIDEDSLRQLLDYAYLKGINTLDTAYNYGESEKRIGVYLRKSSSKFNIISKAPRDTNSYNLESYLRKSIKLLNVENLYGYLYHDFNDFTTDPDSLKELRKFQNKGLVKKIGFSLYYPEQLDFLFGHSILFDIVQIPFSLADRRFLKYFERLRKNNVEIFVRSVFLQGLFYLNPDKLPSKLEPFTPFLRRLNEVAIETKQSIESLAINYVFRNELISKIVIGVDNQIQLKKNISSIIKELDSMDNNIIYYCEKEISKIKIPFELLNPSNWV